MTSDRLYATLNTKFPTAKLKFIAVAIAARTNEEGKCYPSYSRISQDTGYSRGSALIGVKYLETIEFLKKEKGGGTRTNTYTLRKAVREEGKQWHFEGWGFEVPQSEVPTKAPVVSPEHRFSGSTGIVEVPPSIPTIPGGTPGVPGVVSPRYGVVSQEYPNDSGNDSSNDSLDGSATAQATESQSPPEAESSLQVKEPDPSPGNCPGKSSSSKYLWNKWKGQGSLEGFPEIEIRYAILYLLRYKTRNNWYIQNLTDFGFIRRNIKKMMDDTPPGWRPSDAPASGTSATPTPDSAPLWDRMEMGRQAVSNLEIAKAYFKQHQTEYEHNPAWGEWKKDFEWRKIL
jgi:hypothetical protein